MTIRVAWVGFHVEGLPAFEALLREEGISVVAAVTLSGAEAAKRSGVANYRPLAARHGVPVHDVVNVNDDSSVALLRSLDVDVMFVIGWSQILRHDALTTAKIGVVGAHASYLPHNRGSAPVNWAIIRGECATGNTLMWLSEGVDSGEIIDQMPIPITPYDTCASIYDAVAETNREMIVRLVRRLAAGERPGYVQPDSGEPLLPRRRPGDGVIDWTEREASVYNFVRALTRPYPGAFSWLDGKRWTIWEAAALPPEIAVGGAAGEVLGRVVSPVEAACGQLVATGKGAVLILEAEDEDGEVLSGRRLSDQQWRGRCWGDGNE